LMKLSAITSLIFASFIAKHGGLIIKASSWRDENEEKNLFVLKYMYRFIKVCSLIFLFVLIIFS
jgi:hypothetical protein